MSSPSRPDGVSDDALVGAAIAAKARAYAPYSGFSVGAAVLGGSGAVFRGCNVENASFPLTVCAERVAINTAIAAGETHIVRIAVVSDTSPPAGPCGACRQVIWEFGPDCDVIFVGKGDARRVMAIRQLLPEGFDGAFLRKAPSGG